MRPPPTGTVLRRAKHAPASRRNAGPTVAPAMAFTSSNQYLDAEWLAYTYQRTRKGGAVGVDGPDSRRICPPI